MDTAQQGLDPLASDEPESPESVGARDALTPAQLLQGGETRQVAGTWSALECLPGGGLDFVVQAAGVTYIIHTNAPEPLILVGEDAV